MISFKSALAFTACFALCAAKTVKLPDGFKICRQSDPDKKNCYLEAAKINSDILAKGYPEIDFPPINPVHLDHIEFNIGEPGSQLAFTVQLDNIVGEYEIVKYDNFEHDPANKKFSVREEMKYLKIKANHTSNGKLFVGQINGKGGCTVTILDPVLVYTITYSDQNRDGDAYIHVEKVDLKISPKKFRGYFDNLVGRDKNINDSVNKAINDNWKVLYPQIGPVVEMELAKVLKDGLNRFFDKVPRDQLFPA